MHSFTDIRDKSKVYFVYLKYILTAQILFNVSEITILNIEKGRNVNSACHRQQLLMCCEFRVRPLRSRSPIAAMPAFPVDPLGHTLRIESMNVGHWAREREGGCGACRHEQNRFRLT